MDPMHDALTDEEFRQIFIRQGTGMAYADFVVQEYKAGRLGPTRTIILLHKACDRLQEYATRLGRQAGLG